MQERVEAAAEGIGQLQADTIAIGFKNRVFQRMFDNKSLGTTIELLAAKNKSLAVITLAIARSLILFILVTTG